MFTSDQTASKVAAPVTVHDPASNPAQEVPFAIGATDRGTQKGSQGSYKREVRNVAAGFPVQPALQGQFAHPIPPPKGDRW